MSISSIPLLAISLIAIAGMLIRPWRSKEWMWACGGALLLLLTREVTPLGAVQAVLRGGNVYGFLLGIMALSELARRKGLFDWLASRMLRAARGSQRRLLLLVYALGTLVTILLSNDTTAVVLTPAVFTALARTDVDPMPYLYACAFVANAASFVLPVSNPANLVVFGHGVPPLVPWLRAFALPALAAIVVTYGALRWSVRRSLVPVYHFEDGAIDLDVHARIALVAVTLGALALVLAAFRGWSLGLTASVAAIAAISAVAFDDRSIARYIVRNVSWHIVPLVAGLFVIVQALDGGGAISLVEGLMKHAPRYGFVGGNLLVAGVFTIADNVFNNLPVALAGGYAMQSMHASLPLARSMLVGVDLGPNLSVTGSLATLLWLIALRRQGLEVTPWQFLRLGAIVTVPALLLAVLLVR